MYSIVTDGSAEPKLTPEDATPAQGKRRRGWIGFSSGGGETPVAQRLARAVALATTLTGGGWLLLRGVSVWQPAVDTPTPLLPLPYPASTSAQATVLSLAAGLCGAALLAAAICLVANSPRARRWAWPLLALGGLGASLLAAAAWWSAGVADWAGLLVAFTTGIVAALPNVRTATIPE